MPIHVTRAFLPPLDQVMLHLERAWSAGQLTNNGQLVQQLEAELQAKLRVPWLAAVVNGTLALDLALAALDVEGEVITTPYSYVATTSTVLWRRCTPVFADVDEDTLCIDVNKVSKAITPRTGAILATHVYGIPCNVAALDRISKEFEIPVIYDAAHAFGTTVDGRSVLEFGDISTLSFHATKLFHTGEGGAVVSKNDQIHSRIKLLRAFGHIGDEHFCLGTNAKMSELHAAVGLAVLPHLEMILADRARVSRRYRERLSALSPRVRLASVPAEGYNNAYFPVFLRDAHCRERVFRALVEKQVFPRRYFFPSLNTLPYLSGQTSCPVSETAASTVLCLPMFVGLADDDIDRISRIVELAS